MNPNWHKRRHGGVKGIVFPSMLNQQTPDARKQWVSHSGRRQRLRYLRQQCRGLFDAKDEKIAELIKKAKEIIGIGPMSEYGLLVLLYQSKITSEESGLTFAECLEYIIEHSGVKERAAELETKHADEIGKVTEEQLRVLEERLKKEIAQEASPEQV